MKKREIISNEQKGFSKGKRTSDHLFVLRMLAELSTGKDQNLYMPALLIFRRTFDTVWHQGIFFYKLRQIGVSDQFYKILKDMHRQTKLCVKIDDKITNFFLTQM